MDLFPLSRRAYGGCQSTESVTVKREDREYHRDAGDLSGNIDQRTLREPARSGGYRKRSDAARHGPDGNSAVCCNELLEWVIDEPDAIRRTLWNM